MLLFQNGGEMTPNPIYLSYVPCLPGTIPNGLACQNCPGGQPFSLLVC